MKQTTTTKMTFSRSSFNKTRTVLTTTKLKRTRRKTCTTNAFSLDDVTNLDLNDVTTLCANGAFLSLFVASTVYGTKAVFFPSGEDEDEKKEGNKDKEVKLNVERTALQLSNVA